MQPACCHVLRWVSAILELAACTHVAAEGAGRARAAGHRRQPAEQAAIMWAKSKKGPIQLTNAACCRLAVTASAGELAGQKAEAKGKPLGSTIVIALKQLALKGRYLPQTRDNCKR